MLFYVEHSDEPPELVCRLVGDRTGAGFATADFKSLKTSYDPRRGLLLSFGYRAFAGNGEGTTPRPGTARVRVNLASGAVTIE